MFGYHPNIHFDIHRSANVLLLEASDPGWSWRNSGEKVTSYRPRPCFCRDLLLMLGEDLGGRWEPGGVTSRGRGPRRTRVGLEGQDRVSRWASSKMGAGCLFAWKPLAGDTEGRCVYKHALSFSFLHSSLKFFPIFFFFWPLKSLFLSFQAKLKYHITENLP